jgi:Flp pilus assembly pilin Flp
MAPLFVFRRLAAHMAHAVRDRGGVTAAEYAILAVGIVIVVGAAVIAYDLNSPMGIAANAILDGQSSLNAAASR